MRLIFRIRDTVNEGEQNNGSHGRTNGETLSEDSFNSSRDSNQQHSSAEQTHRRGYNNNGYHGDNHREEDYYSSNDYKKAEPIHSNAAGGGGALTKHCDHPIKLITIFFLVTNLLL